MSDLLDQLENDWDGFMESLNQDIEAPHCRVCDDWHWGECPSSSDQPTGDK